MPWGAPVAYDPFAEDAPVAPEASSMASPPVSEADLMPEEKPGFLKRVSNVFTGEGRTQYPDAPEFGSVYPPAPPPADPNAPPRARGDNPNAPGRRAMLTSNITPDPEAQFDILSKAIPGLERFDDEHGNIMLKAPGMKEFAYLNKPGISTRDMTEFGAQALATAPFLTPAGRAISTAGRIVKGGLGMAAGSVAQDAAAVAEGSDQGIDEGRAAVGGMIGGALPAVGAVARGVVGAVNTTAHNVGQTVRGLTNPREAAVRQVQGAFDADRANQGLPYITNLDRMTAAQRGQDLRVMDFGGETVKGEARKAANLSPATRESIMRVVNPRFEGQTQRAANVIENEFGLSRSSEEARRQIMTQAAQARAPLYFQAYQQGARGINTPVLQQLQTSPIFQRAMSAAERSVLDRMATPGVQSTGVRGANGYTLEYWDQVKRRLDDYARQARRQGANERATLIEEQARGLRNHLDTVVPLYQHARGTAQNFFNAADALEAGQNFARGNFNLRDAEQAINALNPAERNLFAEGFADDFVQKIRSIGDRSTILNRIMNNPTERDRVRLALGQPRYDQLDGFLRLEGIVDRMRHVMGNSTTARQLMDLGKNYGIQTLGTGTGLYGMNVNDPGLMIAGAIMAGGRAGQLRINENIAREVGHLMVSSNPDAFLRGMQTMGRQPILDAIRAFDGMIASLGQATPIATQGIVNANSYQPGAK